jgi:DHA2 family multidrug resistance protein-like MFS transporter
VVIVLVYIPVAIDATVLHVAAPTLSMTLAASIQPGYSRGIQF